VNVRLIAITKPLIAECEHTGDLLAYCARVSNPANQANTETAPKLLAYLVRNQHWSPFEMASMTVEITTTRDIARQILRHRSFSFQEFSQRYAAVAAPPVLRETRLQDAKNRQASVETDDDALHRVVAERTGCSCSRHAAPVSPEALDRASRRRSRARAARGHDRERALHGRHDPQLDPLRQAAYRARHAEGAPRRREACRGCCWRDPGPRRRCA
jgi:thymidylate synthase ThyX